MNGINNSGDIIMYEIEVNMFYKEHVKRVQMDVCELENTNVILDMLWLTAYNPEIDWEKKKVRMTRCSLLCRKAVKIKEKKEMREDEKKIVRWAVDEKENWGREKEMETDY